MILWNMICLLQTEVILDWFVLRMGDTNYKAFQLKHKVDEA